jgi:4-oxalocrotonate tautomerase
MGLYMPVINVNMLTGRTKEQKQQIVAGITDVMVNVAGAKKEGIVVVINETSPENYGLGGELMVDKLKK